MTTSLLKLSGITLALSRDALCSLEEVGLRAGEIEADIERIRDGKQTRDELLAVCLDGVEDAERAAAWTEYVDAVMVAAGATTYTEEDVAKFEIADGEDEVTVYLTGANGPRAHYLGGMDAAAVLARLPAGWTVHEDGWQSAVKIDDLTWSVPLTKVE